MQSSEILPLADELQLLVGRACAYYFRISIAGKAQQHHQYTSRFLEILQTLYLFIRGGLCHMLSMNESKFNIAPETLWIFDKSLSWQEVEDEFGRSLSWETVSLGTKSARPIFALTPNAVGHVMMYSEMGIWFTLVTGLTGRLLWR